MKLQSILALVAANLTLGASCWFEPVLVVNNSQDNLYLPPDMNTNLEIQNSATQLQPTTFVFSAPEKSVLFKASAPVSENILPRAPLSIVIDSTQPLADTSSIAISSQGIDYGIGKATINQQGTTLRRSMDQFATTGMYTITYQLCELTGPCHPGQFQFAIDPFWLTQYQDWTHLEQIDIQLSGQALLPRYVRISSGTTVTWSNQDEIEQHIFSDPQDTHSYYPALSSDTLPLSGVYSYTFNLPGIYPYHAGAFPENMTGLIVVE